MVSDSSREDGEPSPKGKRIGSFDDALRQREEVARNMAEGMRAGASVDNHGFHYQSSPTHDCKYCSRPAIRADQDGTPLCKQHGESHASVELQPPLVEDLEDDEERYASLRVVLDRAYEQAARGKGKERHANDDAFEDQLIVQIGRHLGGTTDFNVGQAIKKSIEAKRLPKERAVAEILGAINYLAAAVIILETRKENEA